MTPKQKLLDHLQKHGQNIPWKDLTELYNPGATEGWAKVTAFHAGWNKVKDDHEALIKECEEKGIPIDSVGHYWYKGEHFSIHVKKEQEQQIDNVVRSLIEEMKAHAPKYPTIKYKKKKEQHLLALSPADVHLNKLCSAYETGDEYNIEIAGKRVNEGVESLIKKAEGWGVDKILLISGNDRLHVDNPKSTTTSGTFQDTHVTWHDAFRFGVRLDVGIVERLLTLAPIEYQLDLSNHDYMSGFFMAQTIAAWFRNNKHVNFNVTAAHRKYFRYWTNLIGSTHGDGAKETDLALLMAHEAAQWWNECKHRYWYTHHLHHKRSKDYMSVTVETLRSPSGTDSWHHRNGYQHAPKAIEGFIHHKEHGQIARLCHIF